MKQPIHSIISTLAIATLTGGVFASPVPKVTDVVVDQRGPRLKVRYTLTGGPAVVTVDFQTNAVGKGWVSIGAKNFPSLSGDVNQRVEVGAHTLTWMRQADGAAFTTDKDGFRAVVNVFDVTQPPDWMAVRLSDGQVRYYDCKAALPGGFGNDIYKTTYMLFRKIPAAGMSFLMGGCSLEDKRNPSHAAKEIRHKVIFTKDYYMAVYETTYQQLFNVRDKTGCPENLARHPIAASGWTNWNSLRGSLSRWPAGGHTCADDRFFGMLQKKTGQIFDLPTEAQWEFACRAGASGVLNSGLDCESASPDDSTTTSAPNVEELAWCSTNAKDKQPVGLKAPNAWDLYDMHGNVYELCLDTYVDDLGTATVVDPVGPTAEGDNRVARGGSYKYYTDNLRSARRVSVARTFADETYGFRVWGEAVAR